ncbi:Low molecular weight protein tyrosine phosphatase (EC [uncultured Gammaproteobacteria bacterium]|nr:Low molecular weight protein tyrosine phosphatase (EC [uncultured Gammaproteobacteria bacterium]
MGKNWILLIIPIYAKVSWYLYSVCIGSFMHLFTRVKKINDTYGILLFLGVKVALRV